MKRMPLGVSRDVAGVLDGLGWASFRFDKRGIGESDGHYMTTGSYDELDDADAAFQWLAVREDVSKVVPIGHSVGATMAVELCARHPELTGAVLLALTVKTGEETLSWQTLQLKDHLLPKPAKAILKLFRTDIVKQQKKAVAKIKATTGDVARVQMAKVNAKWMREFIANDPAPTLRMVRQPLLGITGSKDVQVDPADLDTLLRIVTTADAKTVEDVDHVLRHEPKPVSNPRFYRKQIEKPIDPRVIELMSLWLASHHDPSPRVG